MAGHPESFQNIPLHPSAIPFHLPSPVLPRVRTQEPDNRLASRPPRETRPPPGAGQSEAVLRRLAGPSGPAPSLPVACGFPASSAAVGRAGRSCGHYRVAGACRGPQLSAETVSPAASSMDFEDGERRAGRAEAAAAPGGREGGGRPAPGVCLPPQDGRVALFCGPRARVGALGSGSRTRRCGRPGAPLPRGSASPAAACNFPASPSGDRAHGAHRALGAATRWRVEPVLSASPRALESRSIQAAPGLCDASLCEKSIKGVPKRSIEVGFGSPRSRICKLLPRSTPGWSVSHPIYLLVNAASETVP